MHYVRKVKNIQKLRGNKQLLIVILLLFLLPLTVFIVQQQVRLHQYAAGTNSIEAESGVLANGATLGSDPNASGGEYIQFGGIPGNIQPSIVVSPTLAQTATLTPSPTPTPSTVPTFTLAPSGIVGTSDPIILAAGDISCGTGQIGAPQSPNASNACWQYQTASLIKSLINSQNVQSVLQLGDIQYPGSYYGDFAQYFGNAQQGWGDPQIFNLSHPVPGNHDYTGYSNSNPLNVQPPAAYLNFFGNKATPNGKTYYSYNINSWHLIALDSNCSDMTSNEFPSGAANLVNCDKSPGADEKSWLQQDLIQYGKTGTIQPHACILAYWHHPIYTSWFDLTTFNDKWMLWAWQALYASHADVVLNGHAHMYERFSPVNPVDSSNNPPVDTVNGITELISGTGGRNLDPFHYPGGIAPNVVVHNNNTMGVLQLTLHAKSTDFRFIPDQALSGGAANGTFTDSGTITCH